MAQGAFAAMFDVKQTTYSAWENGRSEPSISKICAIARHFRITTDELLGNAPIRHSPSPPDRSAELKREIESILRKY
jgi:DNA-binding XRE family transcriptional regulator